LIPLLFVLVITLWSLTNLAVLNFRAGHGFDASMLNAIAAAALVLLAIFLAIAAFIRLRTDTRGKLTLGMEF